MHPHTRRALCRSAPAGAGKAAKKEAGAAKAGKQGKAEEQQGGAAPATPGKAGRVRAWENGFAIEDLALGQPSGKLAKPGKKARWPTGHGLCLR